MTGKDLVDEIFKFFSGAYLKDQLGELGADSSKPAVTVTVPIAATGYVVPEPPLGLEESRDIAHCTPLLQEKWPILQAMFQQQTGRQLFLTCTWRSKAKQQRLFLQVPRVTNIDGVTKRSRHNFFPAQAIDVCVDSDPGPGKHAVWDADAYAPLGPICEELGLVWGGGWKSFKDYPHIEEPAS